MKRLHLELTMPHDWERIEAVRRAVGFTVAGVFGDPTLDFAIGMVCAELLENAIKYGRAGSAVRLTVEEAAGDVTVTVVNEIDEASPHVASLAERVAWLGSFESTGDAYAAALVRAYEEASDGGLGLVRVAHEGGCEVRCHGAEGQVTMTATHRAVGALQEAS